MNLRISFYITKIISLYRYELEVPDRLIKGMGKPNEFEFISQRQGFQRFHTEEIKAMVARLEILEEKEKCTIRTFAEFLFTYFYQKCQFWDALVKIIAELDCLCALSVVSFLSVDVMCRPEVFYSETPSMEMKQIRHPCIALQSRNFVANDVRLGATSSGHSLMLLTGPNMGGKSTIMRTVCLTVIMAQIGCYIPGEKCRMTIVDRIFTRIGASDK